MAAETPWPPGQLFSCPAGTGRLVIADGRLRWVERDRLRVDIPLTNVTHIDHPKGGHGIWVHQRLHRTFIPMTSTRSQARRGFLNLVAIAGVAGARGSAIGDALADGRAVATLWSSLQAALGGRIETRTTDSVGLSIGGALVFVVLLAVALPASVALLVSGHATPSDVVITTLLDAGLAAAAWIGWQHGRARPRSYFAVSFTGFLICLAGTGYLSVTGLGHLTAQPCDSSASGWCEHTAAGRITAVVPWGTAHGDASDQLSVRVDAGDSERTGLYDAGMLPDQVRFFTAPVAVTAEYWGDSLDRFQLNGVWYESSARRAALIVPLEGAAVTAVVAAVLFFRHRRRTHASVDEDSVPCDSQRS